MIVQILNVCIFVSTSTVNGRYRVIVRIQSKFQFWQVASLVQVAINYYCDYEKYDGYNDLNQQQHPGSYGGKELLHQHRQHLVPPKWETRQQFVITNLNCKSNMK